MYNVPKCILLFITCQMVNAMQNDSPRNKFNNAIHELSEVVVEHVDNQDQFSQDIDDIAEYLTNKYFRNNCKHIKQEIMPIVRRNLRESDEELKTVINNKNHYQLSELIHLTILDALEQTFEQKELNFEQQIALEQQKTKKALYAMIAAITTTVIGTIGGVLGAYYGT